MSRDPKPYWSEDEKQWAARIGTPDKNGRARVKLAGKGIARKDVTAAHVWFAETRAKSAFVPAKAGGRTVGELVQVFADEQQRRADAGQITQRHASDTARKLEFLNGHLGDRDVAAVTRKDAQAMADSLAARFASNTVRSIMTAATSFFNWVKRGELIDRNPMSDVVRPPLPGKKTLYIPLKETAAWLGFLRSWSRGYLLVGKRDGPHSVLRKPAKDWIATNGKFNPTRADYMRQFVLMQRILIATGARPKELCDANWEDVDWTAAKSKLGSAKAVIRLKVWKASRKTGKDRTIYLTTAHTRALKRERDRRGVTTGPIFTHGAGRAGVGDESRWKDGSTLAAKVLKLLKLAFRERDARAAAGLPPRGLDILKDAGPSAIKSYTFRHVSISRMLMAGVPVATIAELHGTSVEMIQRVYGHLLVDHLASAHEEFMSVKRR